MMMGTGIFLFRPKGAEKIEIKDFNLHSEIMTRTSFYRVQSVLQKIRLFLEGHSTFTFEQYSNVGGVLESSCHELSNGNWKFVT